MSHLEITIELTGPAGIGKSQIIERLKDAIDDIVDSTATCSLTAKSRYSPEHPWEVEFKDNV